MTDLRKAYKEWCMFELWMSIWQDYVGRRYFVPQYEHAIVADEPVIQILEEKKDG